MMPLEVRLLETALYVRNVRTSAEFYRNVFGFPTLLESERLIALQVPGASVLLLFQQGATSADFAVTGGVIPGHEGIGRTHFAFAIAPDDVAAWPEKLAESGVSLESTVTWERGSVSLYFRDPDGHLVELMTPGFWQFSAP